MRIIVGLGNPGNRYGGTRHNIGFEVVDLLSGQLGIGIDRAKHRAHFGEGVALVNGRSHRLLLARPQTYMNLSGESVRDLLRFYKAEPSSLIVAYDDCDLPLGSIRIRERGSAGSHNGMKNIIYQLETDVFTRVRIGIGNRPPQVPLASYVLSRFDKSEQDAAQEGIWQAARAILSILDEGALSAMNRFNQVTGSPPQKHADKPEKAL